MIRTIEVDSISTNRRPEQEWGLKVTLISALKVKADKAGPDSLDSHFFSKARQQILDKPMPWLSNYFHHQEASKLLEDEYFCSPPVRRNELYRQRILQMIYDWREQDKAGFIAVNQRSYVQDEVMPVATFLEAIASWITSVSTRESTTEVLEYGIRTQTLEGFLYMISAHQGSSMMETIRNGHLPVKIKGVSAVFENPYMLYYLASANLFPQETYVVEGGRLSRARYSIITGFDKAPWFPDTDTVLSRMDRLGILNSKNCQYYFPLVAFAAEEMVDMNKLSDFISSLCGRIDGVDGFSLAARLLADVYFNSGVKEEQHTDRIKDIYLSVLQLKERLDFYDKSDPQIIEAIGMLDRVENDLWMENSQIIYPLRPAVISSEVLAEAMKYPDQSREIIFKKAGVKGVMESLFTGEGREEIRPVYDRTLDNEKDAAVSVMLIADILGYPPDMARRLAAIAQFIWGLEDCWDARQDKHPKKRGRIAIGVERGPDVEFDITMLALSEVLKNVFGHDPADKRLENEINAMLSSSCRGDLMSREGISWETAVEDYNAAMKMLDQALSCFPKYMGEKTGLMETGLSLSLFLEHFHAIGKVLNDIGDVDPAVHKHEPGNDIRRGIINSFWLAVLSLPESVVSAKEKELIRVAFNKGKERRRVDRDPEGAELKKIDKEIDAILTIGRRCMKEAVGKLKPDMLDEYVQAHTEFDKAKALLPSDSRNQVDFGMLLAGLEEKWSRFCKYSVIGAQ